MKVVHICTNYNGGAGKAAFRLHNALLNIGVDSVFVSLGSQPLTDIKGNLTVLLKWNIPIFRKIAHKIKKKLGLEHPFIVKLRKLNPQLDCLTSSLPISTMRLDERDEIRNADIINLHGVTHILDYKTFFNTVKKPIVWTLHDINPIAGIFHLRTDEFKNYKLAYDLNHSVLDYKLNAFKKYTKGSIIAPSAWLINESLKRNVFKKLPHYEIRNSIPEIYFSSIDRKTVKEKFGIPLNTTTILFIASDLKDKNKGVDLLLEALNQLQTNNFHLLIVGGGNSSIFDDYKFTFFGYVSDDSEMVSIYNAADLFVIPSRDENLPNVLLESMACGTPVVSFKVGGLAEHIESGINGELANDITGNSLAKSLKLAINNKNKYSRKYIKESAFLKFNENIQAEKYFKIYNSL